MTRRCPGVDKTCGQYLSKEDTDPHTLCIKCREKKCSPEDPCSQCATWDTDQWRRFNERRSYAARKGTPKILKSPKTPVVESPSILPPVLEKEAPLSGPFVTPRKGLTAPVFLTAPTPVRRLQEETKERFSTLETSLTKNFDTKIDVLLN